MSRLIALYPTAWRARYEDEFVALLAEQPPSSIRERIDIVRGAADARLHPQLDGPRPVADRLWFVPLIGLASFFGALVVMANGPVQTDAYGQYRDGMAALPAFVLAFVLLSVGIFRVVLHLPDSASGTGAAGAVAIFAGPAWAIAPWVMLVGLVFLAGIAGLVIGARRAGLMPTSWVVALILPLAIPATLFVASLFLPWYAMRTADLEPIVLVLPFSMLWIVMAGVLRRGFPQATPEAPATSA